MMSSRTICRLRIMVTKVTNRPSDHGGTLVTSHRRCLTKNSCTQSVNNFHRVSQICDKNCGIKSDKQLHDIFFLLRHYFHSGHPETEIDDNTNESANHEHKTIAELNSQQSSTEGNLEQMKLLLECSDSELMSIYHSIPRLCNPQIMDRFLGNINVLLRLGYAPKIIKSLALHRIGALTQICSETLENLLASADPDLCSFTSVFTVINENIRKTYIDEVDLIADLLQLDRDTLSTIAFKKTLGKMQSKTLSACLLKEKIEYLLSEGVTALDIADNLELVISPMQKIHEVIVDMRQEVGEVTMPLIMTKVTGKHWKHVVSIIAEKLNCSLKDLSKSQLTYLRTTNAYSAVATLDHLLKMGFRPEDIKSCVYILGNSEDTVNKAFEVIKTKEDENSNFIKDKQTLLNAVQYQIEFSNL